MFSCNSPGDQFLKFFLFKLLFINSNSCTECKCCLGSSGYMCSNDNQVVLAFSPVNTAFVRAMYNKGAGNDKQGKDARNRTLCPYRNFSQAINLLTNWLAYLYGRIQSPRPDVMPDRREGITRAEGFVFACIDTQACE